MSFKDAPFSQRFAKLGDEAEGVFEAVWPKAWERLGIKRPKVPVRVIPPFVRSAPDYYDEDGLIEVMGMGNDGIFKLKDAKAAMLLEWEEKWPGVRIFIWNSDTRCWALARLSKVEEALINDGWEAFFSDGPSYMALDKRDFPAAWIPR